MKQKVESALKKLEDDNIIEKIQHSEWAAPIVPVLKPNGKLRICGDYKLTINKAIRLDKYPLPLVDEIFANLSGGKYFSKLDLSQAYHQIALDASSSDLTVINTHCGLYRYLRLPYGASPCVGLFQRSMENLLKGLPGVSVFLDDILVTGKTEKDHMQNLKRVLTTLEQNGLRLQRDKCKFALKEVEYLGFKVSNNGIHPTPSKVAAIRNAPRPSNLSELRSFIGLVNYYARFQQNLAHHMAPLYKLLKKGIDFEWSTAQESAFSNIKNLISESAFLAHYDPESEPVFTCDASPFGIGAVLETKLNGILQPLSFISRSLTTAEKHYAQIEREALAIVFAVKKYRQYLLGRNFTLRTDHRPLTAIFNERSGVPQMASSRVKRWALILSAYDYNVEYIPTKENGCADFLSRAPLKETNTTHNAEDQVLHMEVFERSPLTAKVIAQETAKDPILAKAVQLTREGWPQSVENVLLQPYFQ
jgi:hypothetical protein